MSAQRRSLRRRALLLGLLASGCGPDARDRDAVPLELKSQAASTSASERTVLLERAARLDQAPLQEEFVSAVRRFAAADSMDRFVQVGPSDWLPRYALRGWLDWNVASHPGDPIPALAIEREHHPYGVLLHLAEQLREAGVRFLVVTVPARLQIEPKLLVPALAHWPATARAAAGTRFLALLAEEGIEAVDLVPEFMARRTDPGPLRERLWLRANSHWSPRAAELAAELVAARLATMASTGPRRWHESVDFQVEPRVVEIVGRELGHADGAPPERVALNSVRWLEGAPDGEQLLAGEVVVLGDSFVTMFQEHGASFADQLIRFTGTAVDVIAPAGGGVLACREKFARRATPLVGKKAVVWLLPESVFPSEDKWRNVVLGGR